MSKVIAATLIIMALQGCAAKQVCSNTKESFRPIYEPANSCKVRIRQVLIGTDVNLPPSISFKESSVSWDYEWVESRFEDGKLALGHLSLKPVSR